MTHSGLLVAPGHSLGGSCHSRHCLSWHLVHPQCSAQGLAQTGAGKHSVQETMEAWTYVQLFTQDTCPAGGARKPPTTPLSGKFHSPAQVVVSWRGEVGAPLPSWYVRASPQQV